MTKTKAEILRRFNHQEIALQRELAQRYKDAHLKFLAQLEILRDKLITDLEAFPAATAEDK